MSAVISSRCALDACIGVLSRAHSTKRWVLVSRSLAAEIGNPYRNFYLRVPPQKPATPWTHAAATEIDI